MTLELTFEKFYLLVQPKQRQMRRKWQRVSVFGLSLDLRCIRATQLVSERRGREGEKKREREREGGQRKKNMRAKEGERGHARARERERQGWGWAERDREGARERMCARA